MRTSEVNIQPKLRGVQNVYVGKTKNYLKNKRPETNVLGKKCTWEENDGNKRAATEWEDANNNYFSRNSVS